MNIERKARIEIALAETAKALKKLRPHSRISLTDATFAPDRAAPVSPCWAQRLSALEEFFSADFIPEFGASVVCDAGTGTDYRIGFPPAVGPLACSEPRRSL